MAGGYPPQGGYPQGGGYGQQGYQPHPTYQQQTAPPTPPPQPPQDRSDELRSVKRWIAVAVAWAVAATAVALIALLDGSSNDAEQQAGDTASRVSDLQRTTNRRLRNLEARLESLPQPSDQSRLTDRLARVEDQSSTAVKDAKSANDKLKALEERVSNADTGSTDDSPTTTLPDLDNP